MTCSSKMMDLLLSSFLFPLSLRSPMAVISQQRAGAWPLQHCSSVALEAQAFC